MARILQLATDPAIESGNCTGFFVLDAKHYLKQSIVRASPKALRCGLEQDTLSSA